MADILELRLLKNNELVKRFDLSLNRRIRLGRLSMSAHEKSTLTNGLLDSAVCSREHGILSITNRIASICDGVGNNASTHGTVLRIAKGADLVLDNKPFPIRNGDILVFGKPVCSGSAHSPLELVSTYVFPKEAEDLAQYDSSADEYDLGLAPDLNFNRLSDPEVVSASSEADSPQLDAAGLADVSSDSSDSDEFQQPHPFNNSTEGCTVTFAEDVEICDISAESVDLDPLPDAVIDSQMSEVQQEDSDAPADVDLHIEQVADNEALTTTRVKIDMTPPQEVQVVPEHTESDIYIEELNGKEKEIDRMPYDAEIFRSLDGDTSTMEALTLMHDQEAIKLIYPDAPIDFDPHSRIDYTDVSMRDSPSLMVAAPAKSLKRAREEVDDELDHTDERHTTAEPTDRPVAKRRVRRFLAHAAHATFWMTVGSLTTFAGLAALGDPE